MILLIITFPSLKNIKECSSYNFIDVYVGYYFIQEGRTCPPVKKTHKYVNSSYNIILYIRQDMLVVDVIEEVACHVIVLDMISHCSLYLQPLYRHTIPIVNNDDNNLLIFSIHFNRGPCHIIDGMFYFRVIMTMIV